MFAMFLGMFIMFLIACVTGHWILAMVVGLIVWLATRK